MKKIFLSAICALMATASLWADEPAAEASHWTRNGDASLQFSQGYVSPNWYKGGESSFALLATANYNFNYKYEKFTWDNLIEGKLGFVNAKSQYRSFITNNDILKWTSKAGYAAGKNWYYTLQGIGQTQFCTGWKQSGEQVTEISKFINPAYLNISLGMDWKKEKENIKWTVYLSPVAYNLKFVGDPRRNFREDGHFDGRIDGTAFGLKAGDFNIYDFGATAKYLMEWKICKYLSWQSQATYFSPLYNCGKYKDCVYTEIDWENTFDMPLNKYFSTKVYTHLRFDDSVNKAVKDAHNGWGYFQFTELLSFGLSCKF